MCTGPMGSTIPSSTTDVVKVVAGLGAFTTSHQRWCVVHVGRFDAPVSPRAATALATPGGPTRSSDRLHLLSSLRDQRSTDRATAEGWSSKNRQLTPMGGTSTTPPTAAPRSIVCAPRRQVPC